MHVIKLPEVSGKGEVKSDLKTASHATIAERSSPVITHGCNFQNLLLLTCTWTMTTWLATRQMELNLV